MKASIFITCICDSMYPQVGEAMVRVLEKLGVTLDFPPEQTCCGQPALSSGYWEDARPVAETMLTAFKNSQYVVAPAGSCITAVKEYYPLLFEKEPEKYRQAKELSAKLFEFSEFVVKILKQEDVGARFPYRVTYHSSCHARRFLNTDQYVRTLLANVKEIDYVPLPHEEACCGFGGTFSVKLPEISEAMVDAKARNILDTKADVLVGVDLSCLMNIDGRLKKQKTNVRVMHIAELLDEGMRM
ncbi:Lactate utilization protein A [Sporomusa ovata DSM 2662]|uniref:Predicted L-lactate dehydrogenase, Fe-S oxidoreductase subunit YkgE n=1 Tax=Sporomusa ovata TaxID=2378 RepID=A0A0U1KV25_9FIRM|nr:(Fe-S)-binding protein [Sporomusa ovata]EQB26662.1 lactate utilization protein A [Sporomusa ovata DSM 2662]CQR70753.1 Predicted L-lactate dehydrogenase, Fe-S oxidoreductase subunit YkgE [Sporomusa ovata]